MTETPAASPAFDIVGLRAAIRAEYEAVADEPRRGFHFHTGYRLAAILGYPEDLISVLPPSAVESMAGTGNPFALGRLLPGERVVDAGSGSGTDSLIAGRLVGATGQVVGVDMTPAMVEKARRNAVLASANNVEFRPGLLEAIPLDDGWADVVISNGVLNLVPDKTAALREMYRVLRPGGRLLLVDIVLSRPVSDGSKQDVALWTGCIAGGLLEDQLAALVRQAGFDGVTITRGADVFSGAPQHSNAAAFGTVGAGIIGYKPGAYRRA